MPTKLLSALLLASLLTDGEAGQRQPGAQLREAEIM
jgi:hypothetical protein